VVRRLGLRRTFGVALALLAAAVLLLTAVPSDPVVAGLAAATFGLGYMPIATLLALWSGRVHADAPTAGFTRVLVAMAAGSIVAPLLLGPLADAVGLRPVFVVVGALCLVGLGLRPRPTPRPLPTVSRS
jgi:predicted MFS family arabinose efflux permease